MSTTPDHGAEDKDGPASNEERPRMPLRLDDSKMKSSYANVCNVSSSPSEIVLVFGVNHAWERGREDIKVELTNRVILTPVVAKQLSELLSRVVRDHEAKGDSRAPNGKTKAATLSERATADRNRSTGAAREAHAPAS